MQMNRFHISFEVLERLVTGLNSLWGYSNHYKIWQRRGGNSIKAASEEGRKGRGHPALAYWLSVHTHGPQPLVTGIITAFLQKCGQ